MTTPLLPDVPDLDTFGGTFVNAQAVVDPTTDMDAAFQNRLTAQLVMLSHTAPRAMARVTVAATVATLADHEAVWGNTGAVAPVVVRASIGVFTVTWASSYNDLQAAPEAHTTGLRFVQATGYLSGAAIFVNGYLSGARVARVTVYDATGTPADPDEFTVTVW